MALQDRTAENFSIRIRNGKASVRLADGQEMYAGDYLESAQMKADKGQDVSFEAHVLSRLEEAQRKENITQSRHYKPHFAIFEVEGRVHAFLQPVDTNLEDQIVYSPERLVKLIDTRAQKGLDTTLERRVLGEIAIALQNKPNSVKASGVTFSEKIQAAAVNALSSAARRKQKKEIAHYQAIAAIDGAVEAQPSEFKLNQMPDLTHLATPPIPEGIKKTTPVHGGVSFEDISFAINKSALQRETARFDSLSRMSNLVTPVIKDSIARDIEEAKAKIEEAKKNIEHLTSGMPDLTDHALLTTAPPPVPEKAVRLSILKKAGKALQSFKNQIKSYVSSHFSGAALDLDSHKNDPKSHAAHLISQRNQLLDSAYGVPQNIHSEAGMNQMHDPLNGMVRSYLFKKESFDVIEDAYVREFGVDLTTLVSDAPPPPPAAAFRKAAEKNAEIDIQIVFEDAPVTSTPVAALPVVEFANAPGPSAQQDKVAMLLEQAKAHVQAGAASKAEVRKPAENAPDIVSKKGPLAQGSAPDLAIHVETATIEPSQVLSTAWEDHAPKVSPKPLPSIIVKEAQDELKAAEAAVEAARLKLAALTGQQVTPAQKPAAKAGLRNNAAKLQGASAPVN